MPRFANSTFFADLRRLGSMYSLAVAFSVRPGKGDNQSKIRDGENAAAREFPPLSGFCVVTCKRKESGDDEDTMCGPAQHHRHRYDRRCVPVRSDHRTATASACITCATSSTPFQTIAIANPAPDAHGLFRRARTTTAMSISAWKEWRIRSPGIAIADPRSATRKSAAPM